MLKPIAAETRTASEAGFVSKANFQRRKSEHGVNAKLTPMTSSLHTIKSQGSSHREASPLANAKPVEIQAHRAKFHGAT